MIEITTRMIIEVRSRVAAFPTLEFQRREFSDDEIDYRSADELRNRVSFSWQQMG